MMISRIETIEDRLVVGMAIQTSFLNINEDTKQLAQTFMPRRAEVNSRIGKHVFSIQNYGSSFMPSNPKSEFEKWVGVEVTDFNNVPDGMKTFVISSGTYVVFNFKGSESEFSKSRVYIFKEWLPNSGYQLDQKAHFEILNEDYSKDFHNIEEEIWIPIIKKT